MGDATATGTPEKSYFGLWLLVGVFAVPLLFAHWLDAKRPTRRRA